MKREEDMLLGMGHESRGRYLPSYFKWSSSSTTQFLSRDKIYRPREMKHQEFTITSDFKHIH